MSTRESPRNPHAGKWILLFAPRHLLSIGTTLYQGASPQANLDQTARGLLLPRMLRAFANEQEAVDLDAAADPARKWATYVVPIRTAYTQATVAVLGVYGKVGAKLRSN